MTHTPTPWNARGLAICKGNSLIAVMGQDDGIKFSEKTSLANAAHIVKCVNLHDELLNALIGIIEKNDPRAWDAGSIAICKARGCDRLGRPYPYSEREEA